MAARRESPTGCRQCDHELAIRAKVVERFASEPDKPRWISLGVCTRIELARRIAAVTDVQTIPGRDGLISFFGKPADLVEMLDVFMDELVMFRARL